MADIEDVIDAIEKALGEARKVARYSYDGSDLDEALAEGMGEALENSRAAAVEAITAIRQGRYTDAVTTLEREFLPKWENKAAAEAAYKEAMGR